MYYLSFTIAGTFYSANPKIIGSENAEFFFWPKFLLDLLDYEKSCNSRVRPWSLTWNLKISVWKLRFRTWKPSFSGSHVKLWGCIFLNSTRWWFFTNPVEKIVKLDHFPNFRGENKKYWRNHHLVNINPNVQSLSPKPWLPTPPPVVHWNLSCINGSLMWVAR